MVFVLTLINMDRNSTQILNFVKGTMLIPVGFDCRLYDNIFASYLCQRRKKETRQYLSETPRVRYTFTSKRESESQMNTSINCCSEDGKRPFFFTKDGCYMILVRFK